MCSASLHSDALNCKYFLEHSVQYNEIIMVLLIKDQFVYMQCNLLQELIQNADDAGATEVKFLTDSRDKHDKENTMFKNFNQYQGPALYAWNNAIFKKNDWKALAKINRSSKKEDALKVGRFGLGFISVFHLTGRSWHQCTTVGIDHRLTIYSVRTYKFDYTQSVDIARLALGSGHLSGLLICYLVHRSA